MTLRRREFLQGCTAIVAAGAVGRAVVAAPQRAEVLVVVSLRGGWDSLSVVVPRDGADRRLYERARPNLQVPVRSTLDLNGQLGLHRVLQPLLGRLAVVPAAGLNRDTRSHFQATAWLESGTPGRSDSNTGWLTRFLAHSKGQFPAVAVGLPGQDLQGFGRVLSLYELEELDFTLPGEDRLAALLDAPDGQALRSLKAARRLARWPYRPGPGVAYPETDFAFSLCEAARMIKCPELGVRAVTLSLDGWDTHSDQEDQVAELLVDLGGGLRAFADDLEGLPVTIVVLSEFGRRLAENASLGTDHGHAAAMLVLGHGVRPGVYGPWPGLGKDRLHDLEDLAVTVDYRSVLAEVLRLDGPGIDRVFPGFRPSPPLGLVDP
ncbi:MAG: DUF1501 domain-containing protein [Candidatus Eremiobacterota bacterium]